jgi:integrase/recombinase XerD
VGEENQTQRTNLKFSQETYLLSWVESFLVDRKVQGLAPGSLRFYRQKLKLFTDYCDNQVLTQIDQITPPFIRSYLLVLENAGHGAGGRHAAYRALHAFLIWYEGEAEPEGWKNPIRKVKAPKVPVEEIEPVDIRDISKMLKLCPAGSFNGDRDRAILLSLLDTGARATEFIQMNLFDLDMQTGRILIKQGKGRKPRSVYLGKKSRRAIRIYLKKRIDECDALWVTNDHDRYERITYWGLRSILIRYSKKAKIKTPSLHDFRRAFALNFLRNNPGEIYSLQKLMGHTSLNVLRRYLAQTDQDISEAHKRGGPVDHSDL